jgi:hypothetical protein
MGYRLKITHNAGFFSNCTVRLLEIADHVYKNGSPPKEVDSSEQFLNFKSDQEKDNLMPVYFDQEFEQLDLPLPAIQLPDCMAIQFGSYSKLPYNIIKHYIHKYFTPSNFIIKLATEYTAKYSLDYSNLCSVFYRGNDKSREIETPTYKSFIDKAKLIKGVNPNIRFLVQPDEKEFLDIFLSEFPDSIYFEETPMLSKQDSSVFFEIPMSERPMYGAKYFSAILCLSQCAHVINHSGNGGLWLCLYRGGSTNVHQNYKNTWI